MPPRPSSRSMEYLPMLFGRPLMMQSLSCCERHCVRGFCLCDLHWEGYREACSAPDLRIHLDAAGVFGDDLVRDRQAKAGTLADFLGGEKWIEDLRQHIGRYAAAVILNFYSHATAVQAGAKADDAIF